MSRAVVCYLERHAGGTLIRRVRLVSEGGPTVFDRSWNAPAITAPASGEQAEADASGQAVAHTRAAARWVADTIGTLGAKRLAYLVVDPDGSVCTWLSASSPDANVIRATLAQPDADGEGGGGGAARLLALAAGGEGVGGTGLVGAGGASVQALATLERPSAGLRRSRSPVSGKRERYAVLAVPDAPVRVFLDELDARSVEVDQVVSLWHALAMAWDPGRQSAASMTSDAAGEAEQRVVASVSPAAAIIAVDPPPPEESTATGRLVWAWSQDGQLVAGGTMRLRAVAPPAPPPASSPAAADDQIVEAGARRIGDSAPGAGAVSATDRAPLVEFTDADTGRLVLDWLSWSAQLGHCPQRIACIGPAPVPDDRAGPDPGLIGRALGEAWPGASVGVAVHADPIGATLQRLLTQDIADANRRAADLEVATGSDDPRAGLVALSARPGRVDRRLHTWIAAGIAAAALVVGAIGWQLGRAAESAQGLIEEAARQQREAIEELKPTMPQLATSTDFKGELEAEIRRLNDQAASIKAPKPILREAAALLNIIAEHPDVKIERFDINAVTGVVNLLVPDAETGPRILDRIRQEKGLFIRWNGSTPGGAAGAGARRYNLSGSAAPTSREGGA